jgi:hypothetical protein
MLRSKVAKGRSRPQGWCDHRTHPMTVVFTEMGCHASCPTCGAVGSGHPSSEEARRALLVLVESENGRYR